MLKYEFAKALRNKLVYICVCLGVASGLVGLISYYNTTRYMIMFDDSEYASCYIAWLNCLSLGSGTIYRVIAPLLLIPNLDSLFREQKSGYSNFVVTRSSYKKYYFSKWLSGVIVSGCILVAILVIWLLVCLALFPHNPPHEVATYIPDSGFKKIFMEHPLGFISGITLLNFLFATIFFSVGYGLSSFCKNRYTIIALPFVLYLGLTILASFINSPMLTPVPLLVPYEVLGISFAQVGIKLAIAIVVAGLCVLSGYIKNCREVI